MISKKVSVWNPTVANLTLMAIGSSSPEILLTIIETCQTLDSPNPGQLGYANIVGSASFNFLVVTAFAVFAVSAKNDKRSAEDASEDGTSIGVKRVNEMSVYTITIIWSIAAYGWLYFVLSDKTVMIWEAAVTLSMFIILLAMCWAADRINARRRKKRIDQKGGVVEETFNQEGGATQFSLVDFYNHLIPEEQGRKHESKEDQAKATQMREYLLQQFGTSKVSCVDKEQLREKLEGSKLIERLVYRRQVALVNQREVIKKGAVFRRELMHADKLEQKQRHPLYGF